MAGTANSSDRPKWPRGSVGDEIGLAPGCVPVEEFAELFTPDTAGMSAQKTVVVLIPRASRVAARVRRGGLAASDDCEADALLGQSSAIAWPSAALAPVTRAVVPYK